MSNEPNRTVNLYDAPGADLTLEEIFGEIEPQGQPTTTTEPEKPQVTTTESQPFLKTSTGTVYKTADDAIKGVEHKDSLIAQLRQQLSDATGTDPLRKNQRQPDEGPKNYHEDKDRFFLDLAKAVEEKDPGRYMEVQSKLIMDTLAPLAPAITNLMRNDAIEAVEREIPDFRKFANSDEFKDTLEHYPLLKGAIDVAERNPQAGNQLPEFYKMVYNVNRGSRVAEIVEQAKNATTPIQRPTVTSTVPPPLNTTNVAAAPSLDTREGRKALIEQQERAGVLDRRL